jgi:hypothetical protein
LKDLGIKMKSTMLLAGIFIGVLATLLVTNSVDFLSLNKGYTVKLKNDLNLTENNEVKITLPKGTKLTFKSQFDDVGEFYLGVVITDLSLVEESKGFSKYFSNPLRTRKTEP